VHSRHLPNSPWRPCCVGMTEQRPWTRSGGAALHRAASRHGKPQTMGAGAGAWFLVAGPWTLADSHGIVERTTGAPFSSAWVARPALPPPTTHAPHRYLALPVSSRRGITPHGYPLRK